MLLSLSKTDAVILCLQQTTEGFQSFTEKNVCFSAKAVFLYTIGTTHKERCHEKHL